MRLRRLIIGLALVATACAGGSGGASLGVELYDVSCARCHGVTGGGGLGPALGPGSFSATSLTDDQIAGAITVGPGTMPSFGRLSGEQVESLVVYIRSLQNGE